LPIVDDRQSAIDMRILLLSTTTGYQLRSFNDAAERAGVEILFGTDRCRHLDDPWQDRAIPVRFHEEARSLDAILNAARDRPIDGAIAVGDRPVVLAARVASSLGLPGNPPEAAAASGNKLEMRRRFAAAGMVVPWFERLRLPHGRAVDGSRLPRRFPCVVKPLGLSGSRGVIRADSPGELAAAVDRVARLLARPQVRAIRGGLEDEMLIEGFLEGGELAIEAVVTAGRLRVFAIFDKPDPLDGPFFEETIYVTPSGLPQTIRDAVAGEVQKAVTALGLVHGPIHAECRVGPSGVAMLEVAARPIGGLCSRVLRFEPGGATLEDVLLRHALGGDLSASERESQAAGVMMVPIPRRGVFRRVEGHEEARAVDLVDDVRITAKADQLLEPLPEGASYLGFIFARGPERDAVVGALREAHRRLRFIIDQAIDLATAPAETGSTE
jgi:biotin carboxylase